MSKHSPTKFFPVKESTQVSNDNHDWRPTDFPSFLAELKALLAKINEACLFRGHRKSERLIDSTFARSLKKWQEIELTRRYPDHLINNVSHQHMLANKWVEKVSKIAFSPELHAYAAQGIDPFYEYHKHLQQNPKDHSLNDIPPYGSTFIDFTQDWRVGLFFANAKREINDEGALFVVRQTVLGKILYRGKTPFQDTFQFLKSHLASHRDKMFGHLPLWIEPDAQLKNSFDPKPNRQMVVYFAQMDLRVDLGLSWELLWEKHGAQVYFKLILPKRTQLEVEKFLVDTGITQEFLFPRTAFD